MCRSYRTLSLALSVALLVPVVCQAQELRYKFQAGGKNAYTMNQNQNMKMSLMGQEIEIKIDMSFDITQTVPIASILPQAMPRSSRRSNA